MPTTQAPLPGVAPPIPRTIKARVHIILERHEDARANYRLVQLYYWRTFCDLDHNLDNFDTFAHWYMSVVSAKTLLQRAQEIQRDFPHLAPPPAIAAKRARQGRQGPVGASNWRPK